MPNFQSSLFDTVTQNMSITLDQACEILTIVDKSNYALSDEGGHELADFNTFRQLEIEYPNGSTFDYDAEGNLDGAWNAPNGGGDTIAHTLPESAQDGVYNVTLMVVPDYDVAETYTHTAANPKAVYYLGKLYRTIATTTGDVPTNISFWEEIGREDLSSKYSTTQTFALTCRKLTQCYERLVHEANCVILDSMCDDDLLCKNKAFLDASKLRLLIDGISFAAKNRKWDEVESISNAANQICNC